MKKFKLVPILAAFLYMSVAAGEQSPALDSSVVSGAEKSTVAKPFNNGGMFDLYEENRTNAIPNLITPDFLLLGYSQLRQARIAETEEQILQPVFERLLKLLSLDLGNDAEGKAATDSVAFVQLLQAILANDPSSLSEHYQKEFSLVMQGAGVEQSPVWNCPMDYSQFVPRGRYTESRQSEAYFRAFRYASSALFAFQSTAATGVDKQQAELNARVAVELGNSLSKPVIKALYDELYERIEWNFGRSEDMRLEDLMQAATAEENKPVADLAAALLKVAERNERIPEILGGVVDVSQLESGLTASRALIGWRFLPATYSASAAAFQTLVYESGDSLVLDCESCESPPVNSSVIQGKVVKGYPSYLELMSMLGSPAAKSLIDASHLNRYSQYNMQSSAALHNVADSTGLEQRENNILQALFRSSIPAEQALSGAAGFWAWQKYLNILYQKQSYSVIGKGLNLKKEPAREGAWIVPATRVYMALADLIDAQVEHDGDERWENLKSLVDYCIEISNRIDLGLAPTTRQEAFLNELDTGLKLIGGGADRPIVVDLHTNAADARVLELGIGKPSIRLHDRARGAGFSVTEFTVPIDERLNDETWRSMLATDSAG